jgi:hypothetical protein
MNFTFWKRLAATFVMLLATFSISVFAQGTTTRVAGTVRDQSGAAIAGAKVTLINEGTGVSFETQTSESGTYVFDSVQVGVYSVRVDAPNFAPFLSKENQVSIGRTATIDASLQVGGGTDVVEVTDTVSKIQQGESGNIGNLVDKKSIVALPIVGTRGRNPIDFILFQPGVVSGSNTGGGIHVNGARDRAFNFTIDGIDSNETSAGGSNLSPTRINPDGLAEFRTITSNPTAENGRSSGAQVNLVTKSGTNEFHGTAFYFYQTPRFQAREYENNFPTATSPTGAPKRQFVQHIPGGSFGGPILKNKLFFFANFQALRALETRPVSRIVYTSQARQGIFRYTVGRANAPFGAANASVDINGNPVAGVTIGTYNIVANDPQGIGLDPSTRAVIGQTPLPNDFSQGDGLNTAGYLFNASQKEKQEDYTFKVDYVISDRQSVYGRVSFGRQDSEGDFANAGASAFPGTPRLVDTKRSPRNMAFNHRWNFSPTMTNEFVVGLNRFTFSFDNPDPNFNTNPPFVLADITNPLSNAAPVQNRRALTTIQVVDNFTYIHGSHTYKMGMNLRFGRHIDRRTSVGGFNTQPAVDFSTSINAVGVTQFNLPATGANGINAAADLPRLQRTINNLLGRVGQITQSFVAINGTQYGAPGTLFSVDARYPEYDLYIQDTWRFRQNLTFDYGLRWEGRPAPGARNGKLRVPNQPITLDSAPSNTVAWFQGQPFSDDLNNFAPTVGFAWDPFRDGKTAIRANYRLAYDRLNTFVTSSFILPNIPGTTVGVSNVAFGGAGGRVPNLPTLAPPAGVTPDGANQPAAFGTGSITVFDRNYRTPKTNMWSLSIQRELWKGMVLEANYIGRRGVGLLGGYNANQADIFSTVPGFNENFVQAFNTVKGGGESPLMNALLLNDSRRGTGQSGSALARSLFASQLSTNSVASVATAIGTRVQSGQTLLSLGGFSPFLFFRFPQFTSGAFVIDSNDISTYHAGQIQLSRGYRNGFSFQASYTYAKSLDTRSFDPTFAVANSGNAQSASSTPFDLRNRRLNYAPSDFDRRHTLQGTFLYELPFGRGRQYANNLNPVVDRIIGGWMMAGIVRVYSGRPFTVYSGSNTLSNAVQSFADCNGCSRSLGEVRQESGTNFYFTADERARFSIPAAGSLGNTGRNYFYGPSQFQMDLTVAKSVRIRESMDIQYRLEMQNLTNTPSFNIPTATITSTIFGRIRDGVVSSSRKIQMALKFTF